MRSPSLRWRLSVTTTALAAALAAVLVGLVHAHTRAHLAKELERSLEEKCDATITVLSATTSGLAVETFLRAETSYRDSPYEYFIQILDGGGRPVVTSGKLDSVLDAHAAEHVHGERAALRRIAHPRDAERELLCRSERLPPDVALGGRSDLVLQVAVTLDPLERSLRASLLQLVVWATAALAFLFGALWFSVGSSLRRVSEVSQRAATITNLSLRERLPVHASGDELAELSSVVNEMLDGLQRAWTQMESFTSDAAHQLRTPLTRIRGALDVLLQSAEHLSDAERAQLEGIRSELERLTRTCGRLLLLARLDRGALEQELLRDRIDLGETASEIVEQIAPLARERGVAVACGATPASPVRCSQPLVAEALLNLLHNAVRFTPAGGRVEVSVRRGDDATSVVVADDGPGIPEDLREAVFQRFFRAGTEVRAGDEGEGLGLAIVRGISRAHGGDVSVEANSPRGARFVFTLPNRA